MPIKGMTDQAPQFPRIGVLRKGGAKPTEGNRPGPDLKHFRFTDADDAATAAFKSLYGDQPVRIRVLLPYPTPEKNFQAWMEEYTASSLIRRCDGENQVLVRAGTRYDMTPRPCMRANGGTCNCKQSGRLAVIIPDLKRAGYVTVLTTSKHDIINLSAQLAAAAAIVGDLSFRVPFILSRKPVKITTPTADGKAARREKWLLSIEIDPSFVQAKLSAMQRDALLQLAPPVMPAVDDVDDDEDIGTATQQSQKPQAVPLSIEEARGHLNETAQTAIEVIGQLSQGGFETEAGALDSVLASCKVDANATVEQIMATTDKLAGATRDALAGHGDQQAEALAGDDKPTQNETPSQVREVTARVKRQIAEQAARYANRKASDAQKKLFIAVLVEACGNNDANRHTVQVQVFGVARFEEITDAQMIAGIDWLRPFQNGDKKYHPNAEAIQDVARIVSEAMTEAGQQPLM